jgi:ribosomal protein S17
MAVKNLHRFFYYHSKYLNSMKCREISMGPSIHIIQCRAMVQYALQKGLS